MSQKQISLALDAQLGTASPFWRFSLPNGEFVLFSDNDRILTKVKLEESQADAIRSLTGVASIMVIDACLFGKQIQLHLIGKKINIAEWAGVAAALSDSKAVARNFTQALLFAEQIVTEVNAVVVVVNRFGDIQRFNNQAEEYTGKKEKDVVGMNAQELFMNGVEGRASRENIAKFFDEGMSQDVERHVETVKGSRLFVFRNRFAKNAGWPEEKLLVCSGIDITEMRSSEYMMRSGQRDSDQAETYCIDIMNRIMNWASMVDGARALLASFDNGDADRTALAHAKRIAAQAVGDAYALHEQLDARLLRSR